MQTVSVKHMVMNSALISILWCSASIAEELPACEKDAKSGVTSIRIEAPRFPTTPVPFDIKEGRVLLEILVSSLGIAEKVTVLNAEPKGYFERSAIKAAKQSKFSKSENEQLRCAKLKMVFKLE